MDLSTIPGFDPSKNYATLLHGVARSMSADDARAKAKEILESAPEGVVVIPSRNLNVDHPDHEGEPVELCVGVPIAQAVNFEELDVPPSAVIDAAERWGAIDGEALDRLGVGDLQAGTLLVATAVGLGGAVIITKGTRAGVWPNGGKKAKKKVELLSGAKAQRVRLGDFSYKLVAWYD